MARIRKIPTADANQVQEIRRAIGRQAIEFIVLEKVHGSNFGFATDGQRIDYYSRHGPLPKDKPFVRRIPAQGAMQQYHAAVLETYHILSLEGARYVRCVVVYGEYCGGWYPAEGLPCHGNGAGAGHPVQSGVGRTVAYSPWHHVYASEVSVDGTYLDFDYAMNTLRRAGFPLMVGKCIIRGSFETCLGFDVDTFCTKIADVLGLSCHAASSLQLPRAWSSARPAGSQARRCS